MRVTDAALLAYTKFRARVFRSITIGIMAGLLFGVLILGSFVLTGVANGINSYASKGFGNRYIVALNQVIDYERINEEVNKRTDLKQRELVAEAKKKNEYNPESPPYLSESQYNDINQAVMKELYPAKTVEQVTSYAATFNPKGIYQSVGFSSQSGGESGQFTPILDGKEVPQSLNYGNTADPFSSPRLNAKSWELVKPFVVDESIMADESKIPILIPMSAAMKLAGITVNDKTPLNEAVAMKQQAREKTLGQTVTMCYRNTTAQSLMSEATAQAEQLEINKDNKDYKKPALLYEVPKEACKPVTVVQDTRTKAEKDSEAKVKAELKESDPITGEVAFTIAGYVPSVPNYTVFSLGMILQTGPLGEFVIPYEKINQNAFLVDGKQSLDSFGNYFVPSEAPFFVEFDNRADQKRFIESTCQFEGFAMNPYKDCLEKGIEFSGTNYGNPRVQVEEQIKDIINGSKVVITIMFVIASILMMLAISKVIADSRRETGVFRAIGAKRRDIAQIYLTYSVYLAIFAYAIAAILATGVATWLTNKYSSRLTLEAIDNFAVYENPPTVILFGINPMHLVYIFGIAILAGFVGGLIPITGNVRRNPIKDMRDE